MDFDIPESEIEERFVHASGPGGQNVNKVSSAVQLRFDAARSRVVGDQLLHQLRRLAGSRMNAAGVVTIDARRYRTQEANRRDARRRLVELLARAARPQPVRRATRPSAGARQRRMQAKARRARTKQLRRPPADDSS